MKKKHGSLRRALGESAWVEYQAIRDSEKTYRCNAKRGDAVTRWRQRLKENLFDYKGAKCLKCGYDKRIMNAYAFHHRDPSKKEFGIGSGVPRSFERVKTEADKCDLLCLRCHAELHAEEHDRVRERTLKMFEENAERWKKRREDFLRERLGVKAEHHISRIRIKRSSLRTPS